MRHPRTYVYALAACLVVLQAADFCLTWLLLASGLRSDVYEANPLALRILREHGWFGLAVFKGGCSLIAMTAALAVSRSRPAAALRLLVVLCLVMAGVVGYSGVLVAAPTNTPEQDVVRLERRATEIGNSITHIARFGQAREKICREVLVNPADLPAGVAKMRECVASLDPALQNKRNPLPALRDDNQVAAYLYHHASRVAATDADLRAQMDRLTAAMAQRYPAAPRMDVMNMARGVVPCWQRGFVAATYNLTVPQG